MTEPRTVIWPGKSGNEYRYWVFPLATNFAQAPGNYIFAKEIEPGKWVPVYIGQASDLADRVSGRVSEDCARKYGATHIHVHRNENGITERGQELEDLIACWQTPCNEEA